MPKIKQSLLASVRNGLYITVVAMVLYSLGLRVRESEEIWWRNIIRVANNLVHITKTQFLNTFNRPKHKNELIVRLIRNEVST